MRDNRGYRLTAEGRAWDGYAPLLTFRPLGAPGIAYPAWFTSGKGRSGVYAIRGLGTTDVLYVGESHSGRLYETCSRHFQGWRDARDEKLHPTGWHVTFNREFVEVALLFRAAREARKVQDAMIRELKPSHNSFVTHLTPEDIQTIREHTGTLSEIAERYGVSINHACNIRNGMRRRHA